MVDTRQLNLISESFHQFNIESTVQMVERLTDAKILTGLDAQDGVFQLPLKASDQCLTAFTANQKQYKFLAQAPPQGHECGPLTICARRGGEWYEIAEVARCQKRAELCN